MADLKVDRITQIVSVEGNNLLISLLIIHDYRTFYKSGGAQCHVICLANLTLTEKDPVVVRL